VWECPAHEYAETRRWCCCSARTSVVPAWGPSSQCRSTLQPNVSTTNTYDSSSAKAPRASPRAQLSRKGKGGTETMTCNPLLTERHLAGRPQAAQQCPCQPPQRRLAHPPAPRHSQTRFHLPATLLCECGGHTAAGARWERPAGSVWAEWRHWEARHLQSCHTAAVLS
jgi:hypothetical protein